MSAIIGASLALLVGVFATWTGLDRARSFYSTVVIVIASYYVLFAVLGGASVLAECVVMAMFAAAAIAGLRKTEWWIVAALATHGVLDLVHARLISNPGVPPWWPDFCSAFDVVAAMYVVARLIRPVALEAWGPRQTPVS